MGDSMTTKMNLAGAVKVLALSEPFGKISVSEVAAACGITRQAFYYHFNDKRALLTYLYESDFAAAAQDAGLANWAEKLGLMLHAMEGQRPFYTIAAREDKECLPALLHGWFAPFLLRQFPAVPYCAALGYEQQRFTADFISYGLCRTILLWAQGGMEDSAEVLQGRVAALLEPLLKER